MPHFSVFSFFELSSARNGPRASLRRRQRLPRQFSREKRQGVRDGCLRTAQSLIASRVKGQIPAGALLRLSRFRPAAVLPCLWTSVL
jgi:hypothetical protein